MDAKTLEAMLKVLPDPANYPNDEYCHELTARDLINNKQVEVRVLFRKDPLEKKWIYIETLGKKDPTQEF